MIILLYFKFARTLVFTICPTVVLNIGDSSIRCLDKNTDGHQQSALYHFYRSSGLETGQQKINAIADDELPNLILNWSKEPIILF